MPDAAAADRTSRFRAGAASVRVYVTMIKRLLTFIGVDAVERLHKQVRTTAGNVDQRTFLAQPEAGGDSQTLGYMSIFERPGV